MHASSFSTFLRSTAFALIAPTLLIACVSREVAEDAETSEHAQTSWGGSCAASAVDITPTIAAGQTYQGTVGATASLALSTCGNRTARAKLLRYDLPSYGNYRVDVTSAVPATDPSAKDAAVVVRSDCTSIVNEIACNGAPAEKSTFVGYHLSGPIYIHVEGAFFAQGFDLTITKLPFECMRDSDCTDWPDGRCNQLNGNCISHLQCRGSLGNCDSDWDNGCETDLTTSAEHCGACRAKCDTSGGHASSATCSAGKCELTCETGFANCDGFAKTGCEADLENEGLSCGACGTTCGGGVCRNATCQTTGEQLAEVPVVGSTVNDRTLVKLALGDSNVFVSTNDYVSKLYAVKKVGGALTKLSDHGGAFDVANGGVVWGASGQIERWSETSETTTLLGATSRSEWIQDLATNGTDVWVAYRDTNGIGVLRGGTSTVVPFWGTDGMTPATHVARLEMGGPNLVARPVSWSGYAYNSYWRALTVFDPTGTPTTTDELPRWTGNVAFVADATHVYYGTEEVSGSNPSPAARRRSYGTGPCSAWRSMARTSTSRSA